ncbi:MAG: glutaredoxin 3 [Alphaproteobacteria bacterium]|nr:glutaredoxin 3 [Alphaproteobacteria bacterium]
MARVEIYTTLLCPYCNRAKALLRAKNIDFTEVDVGRDGTLRHTMTARAGGRRTVPQIFIGGLHIGGCDELLALEAQGQLDALLAA